MWLVNAAFLACYRSLSGRQKNNTILMSFCAIVREQHCHSASRMQNWEKYTQICQTVVLKNHFYMKKALTCGQSNMSLPAQIPWSEKFSRLPIHIHPLMLSICSQLQSDIMPFVQVGQNSCWFSGKSGLLRVNFYDGNNNNSKSTYLKKKKRESLWAGTGCAHRESVAPVNSLAHRWHLASF